MLVRKYRTNNFLKCRDIETDMGGHHAVRMETQRTDVFQVDPGSAAWAAQWLASLEKGVTRDGLLAAMRAEPLAPYGFRQSFGDAR